MALRVILIFFVKEEGNREGKGIALAAAVLFIHFPSLILPRQDTLQKF
jgi:hypothetical protein